MAHDTSDETATLVEEIPWRSGTFQIIMATILTAVMGVSLISPTLPVMRDAIGLTNAEVGLVITAYTLPGILLSPLVGVFADRFGRRSVLVPLLLVFGVAGTLVAFANSLEMILLFRVLQGVGASGLTTLSVTLIGDVYYGGQRNAIMGMNTAVISVGAMVFPLIGGALAERSWNAPFLLYTVAVAIGILAIFYLEEPKIESTENLGFTYLRDALSDVPVSRVAFLYLWIFVIFAALFGGIYTLVPLFLEESLGFSSGLIGVVLAGSALSSTVASLANGRFSIYISHEYLVVFGIVVYGLALLGMGTLDSRPLVIAAVAAFGIGTGVSEPAFNTALSEISSPQFRAGLISVRTSVIRIGQTVGPAVFTFAATYIGFRETLYTSSVLLLVIGLLSLMWLWYR